MYAGEGRQSISRAQHVSTGTRVLPILAREPRDIHVSVVTCGAGRTAARAVFPFQSRRITCCYTELCAARVFILSVWDRGCAESMNFEGARNFVYLGFPGDGFG